MEKFIIQSQIKKKILQIGDDRHAIIVLKGISMSLIDDMVNDVNLEELVENKLAYFNKISEKRKFMTYEEFLLLDQLVILQYKKVYILNNNLYMEQYPVDNFFSPSIKQCLLTHFSESDKVENDDRYIGDIDEYAYVFEGLKEREKDGELVGAYITPISLQNYKVVTINLFDKAQYDMKTISKMGNENVDCDLIEESDYINFIEILLKNPKSVFVRISNYTGDVNKLKDHIELAAYYWKEVTEIYIVQNLRIENEFVHRTEYTDILKKYWGYSSYRNIKVYNMDKIDIGEKEVVQVSQEQIVSNLVEQVENCGNEKEFRDVFVTAPTGAGKSVMFQVPAIYLAEKYDLLTIVISPLIGLMKDQVQNLELKNCDYAKTINSDMSPIIKQDILEKVANDQYHILYISPETLLSRSDVEQLIGDRTIGMIVIDEAHIVTTWGKQFRPDYWYLGDHIKKLRKNQIKKKNRSFVIATFTATAIYRGIEDMYTETINSLHMLNPITYLGYVKRNDISIVINHDTKDKGSRNEYEFDKFEEIEKMLQRAIITNKKTLIYFPTVALIQRCYEFLRAKNKIDQVAMYYGSMSKDEKDENYEMFLHKEKIVMLATKAFGMGIDIKDIELVVHYAPTGNVCDYVQEIGRAARQEGLQGEAYYHFNKKDFKYINRLHGLSTIYHYQLVEIIKKIVEIYRYNLKHENKNCKTKKRNAMLLDAENFSYIFQLSKSDEDNGINKVKTALLLIQKDFEAKIGFSPITVRPIPMFSIGFFQIEEKVQGRLIKKYPNAIIEIEQKNHICKVMLNQIWNKDYKNLSFPKFKYLLYSRNKELDLVEKYPMTSALCVNIDFKDDYNSIFNNNWNAIKKVILKKVQLMEYSSVDGIVDEVVKESEMSKYKAKTICEVLIASMFSFQEKFSKKNSRIIEEKKLMNSPSKYQFQVAVNIYFNWVEKGLKLIENETKNGQLYLINDVQDKAGAFSLILGILESMGCLTFEMLGGANSQLYIYVNQIQSLQNIINSPGNYSNRLLDTVNQRHILSVKMLTYLYECGLESEEIWNIIEDYFLGNIPEKVKLECRKEHPEIIFDE